MPQFTHQRHKEFSTLERPRELVVACAPMRSNVNLSRIVRVAGSAGVRTVVVCGAARIIGKIARDSLAEGASDAVGGDDEGGRASGVEIRVHRTLAPVLKELAAEGYRLVGLEQTTGSQRLFDYPFARRTVLVVGNERAGLEQEVLDVLDDVVEIPVYGPPFAYNAATAATMAMYEYCRQYPRG